MRNWLRGGPRWAARSPAGHGRPAPAGGSRRRQGRTEPERATPVIIQDFTFGSLAWLRATDFVYAFGQGDIVQGKPRSWGG